MPKISLNVSTDEFQEIEALCQKLKIKTKSALLKDALGLFIWSINEVEAGRSICSVNEENQVFREIILSSFPTAKKS